jgi:hypothetical protein
LTKAHLDYAYPGADAEEIAVTPKQKWNRTSETAIVSINDSGDMVGRCKDAENGMTRGIFKLAKTGEWQDKQIESGDVKGLVKNDPKLPDETQTSQTYTEFTGIDSTGSRIVGWYNDTKGIRRPFLMTLP